MNEQDLSMFLCGDVMTGRGIDQILPHPGKAALYEPYVHDATEYVQLAETRHGRIRRPVSFDYIWGDVLEELRRAGPDARIINLETAITTSDEVCPYKEVCYRMHPTNIGCITAAGVDCCCLANNHVLDWGYPGLTETLSTLDKVGIRHAGAGQNREDAWAPAILEYPPRGRILAFSFGSPTSGVTWDWAAAEDRPGVNLLADLSDQTAASVAERVCQAKRPLDVAVVSIHWGSNWGYDIDDQRHFAHRLVDEGVDVVYGHSSHHVKAMEVYNGHLILYGCGDFLNDYEGIGGFQRFRPDLTLMYLIRVDASGGRLTDSRLVPMKLRHFRLNQAKAADGAWLCELLNRQSNRFDTAVELRNDNSMTLHAR